MATTKYWRLRLKGRLSADQVGVSLPEDTTNILRVDQEADETHVYYATAGRPGAARPSRRAGKTSARPVSLSVVTRIE